MHYVSNYSKIQIIDISEIENPVIIASFDTPSPQRGITSSGDYAFVKDSWYGPEYGLQIIDVRNPQNPEAVGVIDIPSHSTNLSVSGNHVYVTFGADSGNGGHFFKIFNISDSINPAEIYKSGIEAVDIKISGDYAYVTTKSGLEIYDVSTPEKPILMGSLETEASILCISDNYIYLANEDFGFQVVDIHKLDNPKIVANVYLPWHADEIEVIGDSLFINANSQLYLYPAIPTE